MQKHQPSLVLELFYYVPKIKSISSFLYKYKMNENINVNCFI